MSRVHDAMRLAGQMPGLDIPAAPPTPLAPVMPAPPVAAYQNGKRQNGTAPAPPAPMTLNLPSLIGKFEEHPFNPAPESHLIDLHRPMETPSEEFRSLRTKINYM